MPSPHRWSCRIQIRKRQCSALNAIAISRISVKRQTLRVTPLRIRKRSSALLLPLLATHLGDVESILHQVLPEGNILLFDGVLIDRWETPDQESAEET